MDSYNVRAKNVADDQWFALVLFERKTALDLARALDGSPLWCMVTLTRDTQESIEGWRD